ncbi:MAG: thioredoxin family protein [Sphingomonas sp.]|nr:thioredoxin family protein [Sphingomonas sp.]
MDIARANFFPSGDGVFERRGARRLDDGSLQIIGTMAPGATTRLAGIVGDGTRAIRVGFTQVAAPAASRPDSQEGEGAGEAAVSLPTVAGDQPEDAGTATDGYPVGNGESLGLGWAIIGALVGGLVLNLMPCVFPILSLKAMHLARAGHSVVAARTDSAAYAAGAVTTSLALGLAILGLRNAGVAVGWSFQLQNPYVILALLLLVTGIALNLAGLFHVTTPSLGGSSRPGHSGSFGTGAMAAFVATPCSAPFMATAVGAAMILPGWYGLLVFGALGLGLALPFLLIGWLPGLRERLPRPGAWMLRLQRILSVPMFVTALGLAWILGRQSGADGMAIGLGATILLGLALWWAGARQRDGKRRSWLPLGPALLAAAGAATLIPAAPGPPSEIIRNENVEPFSERRLAQLRAAGIPVFVDFTADWCLTCKVNEKVAIDRDATRQAFRRAGVVTLVGDWTNGDPAITAFLARHQRNSIPFYVYYAPGQGGKILPQILTADMLVRVAGSGGR